MTRASDRKVRWGKAADTRSLSKIRTSKCGRYRIVTMAMSSSNGYWNTRAYSAERADGTRIGRHPHDYLEDAMDAVEFDNDPNWEPPG